MDRKFMVRTDDVINSELWRLFPVINVDRAKDIPSDYPGAMGVPITFLDKMGKNDGHSGFVLLDMLRPKINGKSLYIRLIIRNLKPELPEYIDLAEWLEKTGSKYEICFE